MGVYFVEMHNYDVLRFRGDHQKILKYLKICNFFFEFFDFCTLYYNNNLTVITLLRSRNGPTYAYYNIRK
jgi:hypothetical protein